MRKNWMCFAAPQLNRVCRLHRVPFGHPVLARVMPVSRAWWWDKPHALRALALVSLHPRPDRRGYWKRRVRCTLVIRRTHEPCVPTLCGK